MRALANEDQPAIAVAALHFAYYWCAAAARLRRGELSLPPCAALSAEPTGAPLIRVASASALPTSTMAVRAAAAAQHTCPH